MDKLERRGRMFLVLIAVVFSRSARGEDAPISSLRDFEAGFFEATVAAARDTTSAPGVRTRRMRDLFLLDATKAADVLAPFLSDDSFLVQRAAAEWLSILKDKRGLDWEAACLRKRCSEAPHQAARLLGSGGRPEYAPVVAEQVRASLALNSYAREQAMLSLGTGALAQLRRTEDHDLIFSVLDSAGAVADVNGAFLEALGYVDDARSVRRLWDVVQKVDRTPAMQDGATLAQALVSLSRLGDAGAIDRVRTSLDSREGNLLQGVLSLLKPRDAANFGDAVLRLAAREPETGVTFAAWEALGRMHPAGFGSRVFALAMSRKPHWKTISRQLLHDVVMAIDPSLNERFWKEYGVAVIPLHLGQKHLVEAGLQRLMFSGTWYWTGD